LTFHRIQKGEKQPATYYVYDTTFIPHAPDGSPVFLTFPSGRPTTRMLMMTDAPPSEPPVGKLLYTFKAPPMALPPVPLSEDVARKFMNSSEAHQKFVTFRRNREREQERGRRRRNTAAHRLRTLAEDLPA
jgi:hypothetical protein